MFSSLILLTLLIVHIKSDCIYPQWKETCQKYCMNNHFYEIQLNQCYSLNPNQLTCQCSGQKLTKIILNIIRNNNSLSTLTTHLSTKVHNHTCIPSYPCPIGKVSCHDLNSYCSCENGIWMKILCPKGNICKMTSCQATSSADQEQASLSSVHSISSSIEICKYFYLCIYYLFLKC